VLDLDGLTRRFGATTALDGLSFSVPEGSLYGFVGRNGAGKTTAMRIVLGVLAPDAGTVRWRGVPVGREQRGRFGYMPEERGLYPKMRVLDQLVHLARLHGATAVDAGRASLELLDRLGIGDRADDRTEALSLGNQQRVQLAAALVHEPELLVLDEPFSGLDPVGVDVLSEVLAERVRRGVAVLFSSHQLELVERLCDGVAIIEGGRLVASGAVGDLRRGRSRDRWIVELEGSPPEVVEGPDSDALLDAARARGRVRRFAPVEPTLAELFRDAVDERAAA
jgi:ABC-2 type transport system ATP-binding protein